MAEFFVGSNAEVMKLIYTGDTDPVEWFKVFEVRSKFAEWDDAKMLEAVPCFLDSKAKRLLEAAQNNDKDSYVKVKKIIIDGCKKSCDSVLYQFYSAKRATNENISRYARRLQELLVKAMPQMSNNDRTALLRAQLCNEVPENLRALIQFSASFGEGNWDKILDMLDKTLPSIESNINKFDIIKKEVTVHTVILVKSVKSSIIAMLN
jgi:hypothetical protein